MTIFERYLSLWVALCIVAGVALGHFLPGVFHAIGAMEIAKVNMPVAALIWLMIIPMLMKIDFAALKEVGRHWRGIGVTLIVNWAVKPFSMALLGWLFIGHLFRPYLPADQIDSYIAGLILLAAAPCTAMVFVWSNLTKGEPHFTLSQVALNDAIMIVAFAPIVGLLLGLSAITVPWDTLFLSVVLYIVVPVIVAQIARKRLLATGGEAGLARTLAKIGRRVARRAARDACPAVRLSGRADHPSAGDHRHARGADPDPGLFQLGPRLSPKPRCGRGALRRRTVGADRREQFLRARGRGGDQPVRLRIRRGARHRRRRADRSAGDAQRRLDRQPQQELVRARKRAVAGPGLRAR